MALSKWEAGSASGEEVQHLTRLLIYHLGRLSS
jgi:hypothetical protein